MLAAAWYARSTTVVMRAITEAKVGHTALARLWL